MRKFQSLMYIAAAAMAFTGCSNEDATQDPTEVRKVILTVTAENADTRTVIDDNNRISWSESDAIEVLEKSNKGIEFAASTQCTITENKAGFTVTLPANASTDLTYAAIYPASAFLTDKYGDMTKIKATLPAAQTPTATSFDPAADLMISQPVQKTAQPTAEGISFSFGRVAALAKMTITNLGLVSGETVKQVSFAAAGKKLAGRCYLDLETGKTGELGYSNSSERIVLDYSSVTGISAASFPVWFASLPCDLAAGETFTVVVTSDKNKTYTKTVTLAEAQTLSFNSGKLSTFTVNMSGIVGEETASDARIATLTYEEIKNLTWAYGAAVDYTNAGGTWTVEGSKNNGIQLNSSSDSRDPRIVLPLFTNDITSVRIETTSGSGTKEVILSDASGTRISALPNSVGSFHFDLSNKLFKTATITATGAAIITAVTVTTGPVIMMDNIKNVVATGVIDATAPYQAIGFTADNDIVASTDGTVVTTASVNNETNTITYTVSANTSGAAREGSITLMSANHSTSTVVKVFQAADVFEVDPATVTLGGDANATAELTLTSDFEVATPEVSDPDKLKVEAGTDGKYTVTALADGGAAETELGKITFIRKIDGKTTEVTVKQAAKGVSGYTESFSTYMNAATDAKVTGTINGDACTWNYVGATTAFWSNTSSNINVATGITLLKPSAADATYILSQELEGGIKKISLSAISNNTAATLAVFIIDVTNGNTIHEIGTLKTTTKKKQFDQEWDISALNISDKYQIKITNHTTAAYLNLSNIQWNN